MGTSPGTKGERSLPQFDSPGSFTRLPFPRPPNILAIYSYFRLRFVRLFSYGAISLHTTSTAFPKHIVDKLTAAIRPQPDETPEEYKTRFQCGAELFASYGPRDPREQMMVALIVASQFAALDCLQQSAAARDLTAMLKLNAQSMALQRSSAASIRLLEKAQVRAPDALPPPAPELEVPEPIRCAPLTIVAQQPIHREDAPPPTTLLEPILRKAPAQRDPAEQAAVAEFHRIHEAEMTKMTFPYGEGPCKEPLHRETAYLLTVLEGIGPKTPNEMMDQEVATATAFARVETALRAAKDAREAAATPHTT